MRDSKHTGTFDNRIGAERRRQPGFWSLPLLGIGGSRQGGRRGDDAATYVDRYEPRLAYCVMLIMTCSILDAFLTLQLLARGAVELNAAMAVLIESNVRHFVAFKLGLTGLSALLLVIYKNVRCIGTLRCEHMIYGILAFYMGLVTYELFLLQLLS